MRGRLRGFYWTWGGRLQTKLGLRQCPDIAPSKPQKVQTSAGYVRPTSHPRLPQRCPPFPVQGMVYHPLLRQDNLYIGSQYNGCRAGRDPTAIAPRLKRAPSRTQCRCHRRQPIHQRRQHHAVVGEQRATGEAMFGAKAMASATHQPTPLDTVGRRQMARGWQQSSKHARNLRCRRRLYRIMSECSP